MESCTGRKEIRFLYHRNVSGLNHRISCHVYYVFRADVQNRDKENHAVPQKRCTKLEAYINYSGHEEMN